MTATPRLRLPDVTDRPLADLWRLDGRGVVVTGAARGVGYSCAARLAEAGAEVVAVDNDADALAAAVERLATAGATVHPFVADVTVAAEVDRAIEFAVDRSPRLWGLVNNVGVFPWSPAVDMTDEQWDAMLRTDLTSAFYGSRAFARAAQGGGVIVNIGSTESLRGRPNLAHYSAAKHGMVGLNAALAIELGPIGIRVVTIAPGLMVTESTSGLPRIADADQHAAFVEGLPGGRIGMPDDVARAVVYLASDMAQFVTGVVLRIDGGEMA